MKVECPVSGIAYEVSLPRRGFSVSVHPMLSGAISCADLSNWYLPDWSRQELSPELTHLLALAYIKKLPVESIAFPVLTDTDLTGLGKVWNSCMEKLATIATKLERRNRSFRGLSSFNLKSETVIFFPDWLADLSTALSLSSEPISEKAKELNRASYKVLTETSASTVASLLEPEQVENMVVRALKNSPLTTSEGRALPVVIADWANKVTEFPGSSRTKWMKIIQIIFHTDYIGQILMNDIRPDQIKALQEHVLLNTPTAAVGSTHSRLLLDRIEKVIPVVEDFSPGLVTKRKVNAGNNGVIDALLGVEKPAEGSVNTGNNSAKAALSLREKLAARMASLAGKGSK